MNKIVYAVLGISFAIGCGTAGYADFPVGTTADNSGSAGSSSSVATGQPDPIIGNATSAGGQGGSGDPTNSDTSTTGGGSDTVGAGGNGGSAGAQDDGGADVVVVNDASLPTVDAGNDVATTDAHSDAATFNCHRSCTYTQGWYKTHCVNDWVCAGKLTLGNAVYTQLEAQALLAIPSVGDGSVILARQLIVSLENGIASDTNPSSQVLLTSAQNWLVANAPDGGGRLPYNVSAMSDAGIIAVAIGASLDTYNQGASGYKPHCQ